MWMPTKLYAALIILTLVPFAGNADDKLVRNIEEFNKVVEELQPGDRVVLANGTWTDVELRLKASGTQDQPIELTAQEPGGVIISGQSNLGISGEYIVVSGLVFRNGFTPTSEVI